MEWRKKRPKESRRLAWGTNRWTDFHPIGMVDFDRALFCPFDWLVWLSPFLLVRVWTALRFPQFVIGAAHSIKQVRVLACLPLNRSRGLVWNPAWEPGDEPLSGSSLKVVRSPPYQRWSLRPTQQVQESSPRSNKVRRPTRRLSSKARCSAT